MNVKRFVGRNAREAMAQARAAFGEDAVVLSNRPVNGGVEIIASAGADIVRPALSAPAPLPPAAGPAAPAARPRATASAPAPAATRPEAAPMSTLSFQDYVRERARREAEAARARTAATQVGLDEDEEPELPAAPPVIAARRRVPVEPGRFARAALAAEEDSLRQGAAPADPAPARQPEGPAAYTRMETVREREPAEELMSELRTLRSSITQQLSSMAWFDSARRNPVQTRLLRTLLGNGFSAALSRRLIDHMPQDVAESQAEAWMLNLLSHNVRSSGADAIDERGGMFALVGPTGVGKTTTTAKIAANFALKHGAASVGLVTVDTYRMAAGDQLRAFGRILGIPVHTARDGASLSDLLDLLSSKKLVLVDTVGVGQRDRRLPELFASLPAKRLQRLLVLNAAVQGETLDEVVSAYGQGPGTRCIVSKLDESARCGGVVDVMLRHQLVLEGIANGQRVPEDWHPARARLLAQKALMRPSGSFTPDDSELGLVLTTPPATGAEARRA